MGESKVIAAGAALSAFNVQRRIQYNRRMRFGFPFEER